MANILTVTPPWASLISSTLATSASSDAASATSLDYPTSTSGVTTSITLNGPNGPSTVATVVSPSSTESAQAAATSSAESDSPGPAEQKQSSNSGVAPATIAAAVVVPLIILSLTGFALIWLLRRRRRQLRTGGSAAVPAEMKMRRSESTALRYSMPPREPPPALTVAGGTPLMVSSLAPTETRAYYTGIDTSDQVSMHSHAAPSHNVSLDGEHDPPPPYRPRSVAGPPPISRDASVRTNARASVVPATASTGLMARTEEQQDPFADPADDDTVSEISEHDHHNDTHDDRLSVVSDMSYQDEPTTVRNNV